MSLNAIFRYPRIYRTAMAIATVPDQRMYDTIYMDVELIPRESTMGQA